MSLQSLRHSLLVSERAKLCADARKPVSEYKSVMSKRLVIGSFGCELAFRRLRSADRAL